MTVPRTTAQRTRILFIGEAITLSHIGRPAVLAAALDPDRYEVIFACDSRLRSLLQIGDRYQYVPIHSRIHGVDLQKLTDLSEELFSLPTYEAYIAEDLALLDRFYPHVVVGDMRLSLNLSARLADVPYLNIQSCYWHPEARSDLVVPASPFLTVLSSATINRLTNLAAPVSTFYPNLLSLRYGLPPPGLDFRRTLCAGDHLAFPDIPEWSPLSVTPENATYVGPLLWRPSVAVPDCWDDLDDDRPILYLSLGSSGQPLLIDMIVDVAVALGCQVIVATASRGQVEGTREGVYVADFIDGAAAAARSQVTVCNGGSTAAPQALSVGCPVLGITSNMDQAAFMALLERTGAGVTLPEAVVNGLALHEALRKMLSDGRYRAAAEAVKTAIDRRDTAAAFEHAIDACIRTAAARKTTRRGRRGGRGR